MIFWNPLNISPPPNYPHTTDGEVKAQEHVGKANDPQTDKGHKMYKQGSTGGGAYGDRDDPKAQGVQGGWAMCVGLWGQAMGTKLHTIQGCRIDDCRIDGLCFVSAEKIIPERFRL